MRINRRTALAVSAALAVDLSFTEQAHAAASRAAAGSPAERELISSAAWCWFGDPRAIYHAGGYRRTYVGWIDAGGNIEVASYDHGTGRRRVGLLTSGFQVDDHNNPSLLMRPDGHLMVFWSAHSGSAMYYRRSARPEDVTSWEPTRTIPSNTAGSKGYTYPNPIQLSAENNRIYLFWRGGNHNPTLSTSPNGTWWSTARTVITASGHKPYVKYHGDGNSTIAMAFTEGHPRDLRTSIYYAAYRGGAFHRADGSRITTMAELPFTPGEADKVYDASATGVKAWVHDVALDAAGRPVIVYATFPSDTDHRYRYARWNGGAWQDHEITPAGGSIGESTTEPNYSGGISLDHENPAVVHLSRQVGGVFEVETWTTVDGGALWTRKPITSGSVQHNYRPISPRGHPGGDLGLLWMHGRYPSYTRYRTGLRTLAAGPQPGDPAAVAWDANRIDVLARDTASGELLHKYFVGDPRYWSGWRTLGPGPSGHPIGPPAAASWGTRRLDVFAVDETTGHLLQRTYADGWRGWTDRGPGPDGHRVAAPAATSWGYGRIDVVARDTDNGKLVHWWFQSGSWHGPEVLASGVGGEWRPTITAWASRRLDIAAVAWNGTLRHFWFDGSRWRGWENLGSGPGAQPYRAPATIASWDERRLDIFAPNAAESGITHRWFDGSQWQGPTTLALGADRPAIAGCAGASRGTRRLDVFTVDTRAGSLLQHTYNGSWQGPTRLDFAGTPA